MAEFSVSHAAQHWEERRLICTILRVLNESLLCPPCVVDYGYPNLYIRVCACMCVHSLAWVTCAHVADGVGESAARPPVSRSQMC